MNTYTVEIEYLAKETMVIDALSENWARIIATEEWQKERTEEITELKIVRPVERFIRRISIWI